MDRINEWQNRDSKQGRVQSSCLFAVLFLRGLGRGMRLSSPSADSVFKAAESGTSWRAGLTLHPQ